MHSRVLYAPFGLSIPSTHKTLLLRYKHSPAARGRDDAGRSYEVVVRWNEQRLSRWISELEVQDIDDMKAFEDRAKYTMPWQKTLSCVSPGLCTKMVAWKESQGPSYGNEPRVGSIKGSLSFQTDDAAAKASQSMKTIAVALKRHTHVEDLVSKIQELSASKAFEVDHPFICVYGSSGTGKTQFAFALQEALGYDRTYYFVTSEATSESQSVYRRFAGLTELLLSCLDADLKILGKHCRLSCSSLQYKELYLFALADTLLHGEYGHSDQVLFPKYGPDVMSQVLMLSPEKRPIIILDEFQAVSMSTPKDHEYSHLLRNAFRSIGFIVILICSEFETTIMLDEADACRRDKRSHTMCHVFGDLPPVCIDTLGLPSTLPDWIQKVMSDSRPLFAQMAARWIAERAPQQWDVSVLDAMIKSIYDEIVTSTCIFDSMDGLMGQLWLVMNQSFNMNILHDLVSEFIQPMFANHSGSACFDVDTRGNISKEEKLHVFAFPKPTEDILLLLSLTGGPQRPAFCLDQKRQTCLKFLQTVAADNGLARFVHSTQHLSMAIYDGTFLNSLLLSSVCVSSHTCGFGGVPVFQFLTELIHEMNSIQCSVEWQQYPELSFLHGWDIPYLAPPNQEWPSFLKHVPGSNFGSITRFKNKDTCGFTSSFGLSGESHHGKDTFSARKLENVFRTIPHTSKLHIVVAGKFGRSYGHVVPPGAFCLTIEATGAAVPIGRSRQMAPCRYAVLLLPRSCASFC